MKTKVNHFNIIKLFLIIVFVVLFYREDINANNKVTDLDSSIKDSQKTEDKTDTLEKIVDVQTVEIEKNTFTIESEENKTINPTEINLTAEDTGVSLIEYNWTIENISSGQLISGTGEHVTIPTEDGYYILRATVDYTTISVSESVEFLFKIDKTKPVLTTTSEVKKSKIGESLPSDLKSMYGVGTSDVISMTLTTADVSVYNNIDVNKVGSYEVIFEVSDDAGNKQTKIVTYDVEPIFISGLVFEDNNYNSKNDDEAYLKDITIDLIDPGTDEIITSTKTNSQGKYNFLVSEINANLGMLQNYAIMVSIPEGYTLANSATEQAGSDSVISLVTKKSPIYSYSMAVGTDQLEDINVGLGKDVAVSLSPLTQKFYQKDTVYSNLSIMNGSLKNIKTNNDKITIEQLDAYLSIKGNKVGEAKALLTFKNGYNRSDEEISKEIDIKVIAR